MDAVFKALADPSRRELLDRLRVENGQTLSELCARLSMTRQAVSKHLAVLEEANLVVTVRRAGRSCIISIRSRSTKSPRAGSASSNGRASTRWAILKRTWS
jgi:DNA-binding transcriptional ArsR family regulator